ncbi:MAG: SDR family NAD(P)-dependent oxidoreductase [Burkholderiales bacterium]|nr:SDR family NAD(P)-dependent oxidoreductase [Burkholderiales bacterium]
MTQLTHDAAGAPDAPTGRQAAHGPSQPAAHGPDQPAAAAPGPRPEAPALSPLKRAFLALEEAQARLAAAESAPREPIAIVGIGCRVPGATGPDELWHLLREGRDAVGPIPRERFDIDAFFDPDTEVPGRIAVREAGFIGAVDGFDAGFFGISPREARGMDPQQRLLLEVAWEALEHAGQAPDRLSTSATGVFIGQAASDYAVMMHKSGDPSLLDAHFTSGVAHSASSGRLSYLLGLQGPSITVDTACSSSLVAVHLACQALRTRECRMALAGGVNLMLSEDLFIAFSHSRMLAKDGRCKTFDAAADGFGRGEGCGIVVLKRLGDALADGDRILAVIRGSAVNQDGPSSGLTAPNGPAQEAVMRAALAQAGLAPKDIGCIEAHGTGTQLGDPLEVQALGHVFGSDRVAAGASGAGGTASDDGSPPLWLGSIKTNLGHLEAAAGVTGLIKLVLALQHRAIPAHLHLAQPSPHIPWAELPFRIPTSLQPWAPIRGRRLAGVSSFGFSGTNAHVIVEEAPALPLPALAGAAEVSDPTPHDAGTGSGAALPLHLYTLSARSAEALGELAGRHAQALAEAPEAALPAACFTANAGRAQFAHRAAITARSLDELRRSLAALAAGAESPGLRVVRVQRRDAPRIAFAFTGQGSQYAGMAHGLYEAVPAFRAALDRAAAALDPHLPRPLLELLFEPQAGEPASPLDRTEFTQPALFAVEVALAQMWKHFGVTPSIVIGHSVGEVAAACVAGVMELDDAAHLICARARLMGALPTGGAMAAVTASADAVAPLLPSQPLVSIAAINAPTQTVIAGAAAAVDALCAQLSGLGHRCQRLKVSHAFHSPLIEPMLDEFEAVVRSVRLMPPRLRLVSNLSGALATAAEVTSAGYWRRHVREAVRFADGVRTLLAQRPDLCVELGPQPALLGFITPAVPEATKLTTLASMRRGRADRDVLLEALAGLYLEGAEIDWRAVHEGQARTPIALPTYPFQRERCWFSARPASAQGGAAASRAPAPGEVHPMLGARLNVAGEQQIHESRLDAETPRWLAEHRVQHRVVVPATAYLDTLLAAAVQRHGPAADTLEDVTVQEAMLVPDAAGDPGRRMQVLAEATRDGAAAVRLCSQPADAAAGDAWVCHVTARLPQPAPSSPSSASLPPAASGTTLAAARAACPAPVDREAFYQRLARCGLDFGPAFHSVQQLWQGENQALGEVMLDAALQSETAGDSAYRLHPVLLDGCLQVMGAAVAGDGDDTLFMPLAIGRYRLLRRPSGPRCLAHVLAQGARQAETRRADVRIFDTDGSLLAELVDVQLKRVAADGLGRLLERGTDELIYELAWRDAPTPTRADEPPPLPLAAIAAATRAAIAPARADVALDLYDAHLPLLDKLCGELLAEALVKLGCRAQAGEHLEAGTLADRLAVLPQHRQLFARLLAILAEQGWLGRDAGTGGDTDHTGRWRVRRDLVSADSASTLAMIGASGANGASGSGGGGQASPLGAELELTLRTGREMADALCGRQDPLQLLFPGGSTETAERVYRDSPPARLFNGLIAEAVAAAASARLAAAPGRPLRVLEIGAGTGGTTAHVLPRLLSLPGGAAPAALQYTFTDIGALFVGRAKERFGPMHPGLRFQVFDLEQDAQAQGLEAASHDIVLASNVVHATRDLRRSLERVRHLLAPGGVLVLFEACAPQAWFDLTVGLTEGWWCFEDRDLRPDYPTLAGDAWVRLLGECGFGPVQRIAGDAADPGVLGLNALLLAQAPARRQAGRDWLVVADDGGLGARLAARMRERGDACECIDAAVEPALVAARLREWHAAGRRWHRVVHAAALDPALGPAPGPALAPRASAALLGAMRLAQGLAALGTRTRLVLLTRGAVGAVGAVGEEVASPHAATLWGFARALRLEHPELQATSIDLGDGGGESVGDLDRLIDELAEDGPTHTEPERALRGTSRKVPRLVRWTAAERAGQRAAPSPSPWRLVPRQAGSLESFVQAPAVRRVPGPGEVEIAVEATGLNFKDVLNALGMYPGDPGPLGAECSGRVVAVGAGVTAFAPGDAVLAMAGGSFASHVTARSEFVAHRPEGVSAEEGASFAIAYLTSEFCLGHLAGLRSGQSVLIHAAAGGVGLAAVRLAQRAGAEVFATAGSPWKRELLRSMGVRHVFDSRSPAFGAEVLAATAGRGVDVVLNSLASELIEPSFHCVATGGCFVEIGKRGIKSNEWVHGLGRGLRYHVVDWGETAAADPALVGAMLARLVGGLADGSLPALPRHVFALDEAPRAFRFMAQARHAGRIVLRHADAAPWRPSRRGTYLVSGGLSGLGLATAAWLAEQGAGRLALVGRRGPTREAEPVIAALRARGVEVIAEALDIADEGALAALLARLRASGPPLRGVWHSAGVLDDAALTQQDEGRFDKVFAPKVGGAALLDRLTRGDALEAFVLYASVAGVFGSAGQCNHSAANAFLDALAHQRRALGLPGLAIDWGAWRDIGAASGRGISERLSAQGLATLTPAQGLAAMQRLLAQAPPQAPAQAAVLAIDWPAYLARSVPGGRSALLDELSSGFVTAESRSGRTTQARQGGDDVRAQVAAAPAARRRNVLAAFVRERALAVLGLDGARAVDPAMPLGELGLDSLLAVELRNTLSTALALQLPATLLFDHPTIDALTDHLLAEISRELSTSSSPVAAVAEPATAPGASTMVQFIEDLSDEEVERQLAARARANAGTR